MQTTPADIHDSALLQLLGDILRPDADASATPALRLQLMRSGSPWQALVDLALGQGVLLPLILALTTRTLAPPIPRSVRNDAHVSVQLQGVYASHLEFRSRQREQLDHILSGLARAGVTPLILKGARYLIDPLGPWCEARTMADFDILVRQADAERSFTALKAAGYREATEKVPFYAPAYSHHLPPLEHPEQPLTLELHVHPLTSAANRIMTTEQVWTWAASGADRTFYVMPPRWHALHGLLHHQVQDRGHLQRKLSIKGVWEWAMLAQAFSDDDWTAVRAHMRAAKALDILDSWSLQARRLFHLEAPWLGEVSTSARAHAEASLRQAFKPYWRRRVGQLTDEFTASFARETLARKYDVAPAQVSLVHAGKNLVDLMQRHRGNLLRRLSGSRDQA